MSSEASMQLVQFLLAKVAEECNEIAQAALKAQQFGMEEVYPASGESNERRIKHELDDLQGILRMMEVVGFVYEPDENAIAEKQEKVLKFLKYSVELGLVHHSALDHFRGD
jgi:hypothetical protein